MASLSRHIANAALLSVVIGGGMMGTAQAQSSSSAPTCQINNPLFNPFFPFANPPYLPNPACQKAAEIVTANANYQANQNARDNFTLNARDAAARMAGGSAGADLPRKAPIIAAPRPSGPTWSVTALGYGDREHRDGFFVEPTGIVGNLISTTNTLGGMGSANATWMLGGGAFFVAGVTGGYSESRTMSAASTTRASTPNAGIFFAYGAGNGWSADLAFNGDWSNISNKAFGTVAWVGSDVTTYGVTGNVNYRWTPAGSSWWVEPTVGASYKVADSNVIGVADIETTRVTGGARSGTEFKFGDLRLEPIVAGYVYSDVSVSGIPLGFGFPNADEGKVWGKAVGKMTVYDTMGASLFAEGDIRWTGGIYGVGLKVGVKKTFN
jgi:hypothetical protein